MVRKLLLVVALLCVVVWTAMCGRSRGQSSNTPVPTLTPLSTIAAAITVETPVEPTVGPTVRPTLDATVSPRVVEATATVTPTIEATATEEATATDAPTATVAVTESATITGSATVTASMEITEEITESATLTEAATVSESATATPTTTMTPSATVTPLATATPSPTATETATDIATETATPSPSATPRPSATVTPSSTMTASPTPTDTPTDTPTITPTVTETVAPTSVSTATLTPSATITERVEITSAAELTSTGRIVSTPGSTPLPRQSITLPTDLPTAVQIVEARELSNAIEDVSPTVAELSPDGSLVAWLVPKHARSPAMLCVADASGAGQNCFPVLGYQGLPYRLVWSPDSNWLAFSEDPAAQALESDLWLFDTVRGEAINRTDDKAAGRYAEVEGDFALDYLPMWDPATGYLYFWRSTPDAWGGFDLSLMRLNASQETAPEVVRAFGKSLADGMVRFGWQRFYLQGPAAIAPDGSQLAVAMAPAHEMDLSASQALWLIDLVDADAEPEKVATALAWQEALPQWSNQPAVARGLQWTADGQGIVVAALSSDLRLSLLLAYYVDAASGAVVPVVDLSSSHDRDAFFRLDAAGHAPRFDVPWTIALTPDSNALLMVTDLGGVVRILGAPLPPTGATPTVLHERVSPGYAVWTRSSSGENGRVLVYGLLVESEARD